MEQMKRYAIYYAPEAGAFADAAAAWLGWDVQAGQAVAQPQLDLPQPLADITAESRKYGYQTSSSSRPNISSGSSSSGMSSESESEETRYSKARQQHTRSKSLQPEEEINPARRSIRIKLHNDEALRNRKHRKTQSAVARTKSGMDGDQVAAQLKSPTSPVTALTKYPRTPAPPRPLIPRRQPSYLNIEPSQKQQKTLILPVELTSLVGSIAGIAEIAKAVAA